MPSRRNQGAIKAQSRGTQGAIKAQARRNQGAIKPIRALDPLLTHPGCMHRIRGDRVVHIRQVDRPTARARNGAPQLQHRVRERVAELRGWEHRAHLWGREGAVVSTCMQDCAGGSTAPTDEPLQKPQRRRDAIRGHQHAIPTDEPLQKPHRREPDSSRTGKRGLFHRKAPGCPILPAPKRHRKLIGPWSTRPRFPSKAR